MNNLKYRIVGTLTVGIGIIDIILGNTLFLIIIGSMAIFIGLGLMIFGNLPFEREEE